MPLRALAELRRASLPYVASAQQSYECLTYVQYTDNIVFPPIVEQTLKNRSQMDTAVSFGVGQIYKYRSPPWSSGYCCGYPRMLLLMLPLVLLLVVLVLEFESHGGDILFFFSRILRKGLTAESA